MSASLFDPAAGGGAATLMPITPDSVCRLAPPDPVVQTVCANAVRDSTVTPNRIYGVTRALQANLTPWLAQTTPRLVATVRDGAGKSVV